MNNNLNKRSAVASIRGYCYQFLHSIKNILELHNNVIYTITVEGIEDLDIDKDGEKDLIQYKYHAAKKFQNNVVAKPIALMFNHFVTTSNKNVNYKLFIYLTDTELPELTTQKLSEILALKSSKKYIDTANINLVTDNDTMVLFKSKFTWELTKQYDQLEEELVDMFAQMLKITKDDAKIIYLPNAVEIILKLAINSNPKERIIKKQEFIKRLNNCKDIIHLGYTLRMKGFQTFKSLVNKQKEMLNIKKDTSDYIVQINSISRNNLSMLIIELAKKFCYKANKSIYRPITFIIDCDKSQYPEFKKNIHKYVVFNHETIKINDGYEDYCFNPLVFNETNFYTTNKSRNNYDKVGFNFKLLHKNTYDKHFQQINFSNQSVFILDSVESCAVHQNTKKFYLNRLDNLQIIEIIGG